MLETIHIRDLHLTRDLDIDLGPGLTVLTGETGAGKSIFIGALSLALGEDASGRLVRQGAERAEVALSFDISTLPRVRAWLEEQALDQDGECLLRRVLHRQGRSKAFINGSLVSRQRLAELGRMLVDVHGQHAHHALLRSDHQRRLLDRHGRLDDLVASLAACHRRCQTLESEIAELEAIVGDDRGGTELLRYQLDELERLAVTREEWDAICAEQRRLAHAGELHEACQGVLARLGGTDHSIESELQTALAELERQQSHAPELRSIVELLQSALIQIREAGDELRHRAVDFDGDPERLETLDRRLGELHDLARKHRVRPDELRGLAEEIARRLEAAEGGAQALRARRASLDAERDRYLELAEELGRRRRETAASMADEITGQLGRLGMATARFEIAVVPLGDGRRTATGMDRVEFRVRMHPSLPAAPIDKAASGGELSRISLAIEVVTTRDGEIPTLVFDEVDVGIGGRTAEIVGRHLRLLSSNRQVVCITHLAQVAALGDRHLAVSKVASEDEVVSLVRPLTDDERHEEIARMLGGVEITRQTRAHALELLERAREPVG